LRLVLISHWIVRNEFEENKKTSQFFIRSVPICLGPMPVKNKTRSQRFHEECRRGVK
jgi:hypothetical protein